ncbi:MAG: hypothetical protein AB7O13_19120 [Alphaproteobacteria bacterium]
MNAHKIGSGQASVAIIDELSRRIGEHFPSHPFQNGVNKDNFETVIAEYLAMSIAFPFIQAGAIHETYKAALRAGGDTDKNAEITGAVGAYLVWDEVGGHKLTLEKGNVGLLQLPATRRNFHAHWLRDDIRAILGKDVPPHQSAATIRYLDALLAGLSDARRNRNVAYMIGFECHAEAMIGALWNAICASFDLPHDERLVYFWGHVGGHSPAEAVHVEMTRMMVAELVPPERGEEFIELCLEAYALNFDWCKAIAASPAREAAETAGRSRHTGSRLPSREGAYLS